MKKLLISLVVLSVMFGVLVMADSQAIDGEVPGWINFNLVTTTLSYGSVIPGQTSNIESTIITVEADNNVNFDMDITLTGDPNSIFSGNIWLETVGETEVFDTDSLVLDTPVVRSITDSSEGVAFDVTFKSVLKVPITAGPVSATGTVTYTITGAP